MLSSLRRFEAIARALAQLTQHEPATQPTVETGTLHPFDVRNVHPDLPPKVKRLFDDGHYAEATYHAFKYLDKKVSMLSAIGKSGFQLMMDAFGGAAPKIKLNAMTSVSEKDEQAGYQFIFAGGMQGIRNPRGHEFTAVDSIDTCLDHLSFVSMLLRRLEQSGYK
jgi:uncharacterized protein (TIGR02391 family)